MATQPFVCDGRVSTTLRKQSLLKEETERADLRLCSGTVATGSNLFGLRGCMSILQRGRLVRGAKSWVFSGLAMKALHPRMLII